MFSKSFIYNEFRVFNYVVSRYMSDAGSLYIGYAEANYQVARYVALKIPLLTG